MKQITYLFTENGNVYDEYSVTIPTWALLDLYKDKWWHKENSRKIESKKDFILDFKGVRYSVTREPYKLYDDSFESYKYCMRELIFNRFLFFLGENNFKTVEDEIKFNLNCGYLEILVKKE
jgi:hypothetical protein